MKLRSNCHKAFLLSALLVGSQVFAQEKIDVKELEFYSLQKHRVDYTAQTDKSKNDLLEEYKNSLALVKAIEPQLKDSKELKIITNIVKLDLWAKNYMEKQNPTEAELKKLFAEQKPRIETRYKLRHMLLKDEIAANRVLDQLVLEKNDSKKLEKFTELAKTESIDFTTKNNGGEIGFIDLNKLDPKVQELLKDKSKNEIVKIVMPNQSVQLVYLEDIELAKDATYEESKETLVIYYKQKALSEEINKILKKGK